MSITPASVRKRIAILWFLYIEKYVAKDENNNPNKKESLSGTETKSIKNNNLPYVIILFVIEENLIF